MKTYQHILGFSLICLVTAVLPGCADSTDSVAQSDAANESGEEGKAADDGGTAEDTSGAQTPGDEASKQESNTDKSAGSEDSMKEEAWADENDTSYLSLPTQLGRASEAYIQIRSMTDEANAVDLANLAGASQQVAVALMQRDNEKDALGFLFQAADLMRAADKIGDEQLTDQYFVQAYYLEGVGRALNEEYEKSLQAFDDAVAKGFNQFGALEQDSELEKLRSYEGFADRMAEWKKTAIEREEKAIAAELAKGKQFDFQYTGTDIDGNPIDLDALKGKVTIVDIWGTWCPPCRQEIPSFVKLQETYGDQGFQMVGLNFERGESEEENVKMIRETIASLKINYPCALGNDSVLEQVPQFEGYPTTLFIDKSGNVRIKAVGMHPYEYLETIVKQLLAEDA
jgi:thiol-disulfide isomerase/thioredoxin